LLTDIINNIYNITANNC